MIRVDCVVSFKHGKPEKTDDGKRSKEAVGMLNELYKAAKERADKIRNSEGRQSSMSSKDMIAMAIDYAQDKVENPPLRSVERNLMMLNRNIRRLTRELKRRNDCRTCDDILESRLVPVQGKRYTEIKTKDD
jgi:hypothetical protein